MDLKDNSYRCPWCGNIVEKAKRFDRFHSERVCPDCNRHYECKFRISSLTITIVLLLFPFAIFFRLYGIKILIVLALEALIEMIFHKLDLVRDPMIRCREKIMPTKGYKVKIDLYPIYWRSVLKEDTVIPIVFVDKSGKALSSSCCVRIENGKWRKGLFECDLKLLEFGEKPENTSDRIYLYNMGKVIGVGEVVEEMETSY